MIISYLSVKKVKLKRGGNPKQRLKKWKPKIVK